MLLCTHPAWFLFSFFLFMMGQLRGDSQVSNRFLILDWPNNRHEMFHRKFFFLESSLCPNSSIFTLENFVHTRGTPAARCARGAPFLLVHGLCGSLHVDHLVLSTWSQHDSMWGMDAHDHGSHVDHLVLSMWSDIKKTSKHGKDIVKEGWLAGTPFENWRTLTSSTPVSYQFCGFLQQIAKIKMHMEFSCCNSAACLQCPL